MIKLLRNSNDRTAPIQLLLLLLLYVITTNTIIFIIIIIIIFILINTTSFIIVNNIMFIIKGEYFLHRRWRGSLSNFKYLQAFSLSAALCEKGSSTA